MKKHISIFLFFSLFLLIFGSSFYNYVSALTNSVGYINAIISAVFIIGIVAVISVAVYFDKLAVIAAVSCYITALVTVSVLLLCSSAYFDTAKLNDIYGCISVNPVPAVFFSPLIGIGVLTSKWIFSVSVFISGALLVFALASVARLMSKPPRKILVFSAATINLIVPVSVFGKRMAQIIEANKSGEVSALGSFTVPALILTVLFFAVYVAVAVTAYKIKSKATLVFIFVTELICLVCALISFFLPNVFIGELSLTSIITIPAMLTMPLYAGTNLDASMVAITASSILYVFSAILISKMKK